jgi:hypothetical protein
MYQRMRYSGLLLQDQAWPIFLSEVTSAICENCYWARAITILMLQYSKCHYIGNVEVWYLIAVDELQKVSHNLFMRCEACLPAEGGQCHFLRFLSLGKQIQKSTRIILAGETNSKVYKNNPRSIEALQNEITRVIGSISVYELQRVSHNLFMRCKACLQAEGGQFQHVL